MDRLGLTQPTVSKHLRVLKDARMVDVQQDAQRRLYRLRPEPLLELDDWLTPYRELWSRRLDALERHLDNMARSARISGRFTAGTRTLHAFGGRGLKRAGSASS